MFAHSFLLSALLKAPALAPLTVICFALPAVEFMLEKFVIFPVLFEPPFWFLPVELL